jgi:hypothetical protein
MKGSSRVFVDTGYDNIHSVIIFFCYYIISISWRKLTPILGSCDEALTYVNQMKRFRCLGEHGFSWIFMDFHGFPMIL